MSEILSEMTTAIRDEVPRDCPGAHEIGFAIPERYNASRILFDNLAHRRGEAMACSLGCPQPGQQRSD